MRFSFFDEERRSPLYKSPFPFAETNFYRKLLSEKDAKREKTISKAEMIFDLKNAMPRESFFSKAIDKTRRTMYDSIINRKGELYEPHFDLLFL